MTRSRKWCAVALALAALALAAGCEKRPTGFDPNPASPEGAPSADVKLITFHNAPLSVTALDYASPDLSQTTVGVSAFAGAPSLPLLLVLDGTSANTFETYRRDDAGRFVRTTDFPLQSKFKFVNAGFEEFFTPDPAPSRYSPPSYLARGLLDGVATHASPLSNESRLVQSDVLPIVYNGLQDPRDSLFVISWIGVPGAVGYWIHAFEKPNAGSQRLIMSLPAPIAYLTAGDLLIGYYQGNNPGGTVSYRLGDPLFKLKSGPPLVGHDYFIRISGVDATGQVIAQTPGDVDSISMSPDLAFLAPPTFSAEKTKLFFENGGTKVARRPPFGIGSVVAGESAGAATIERHIADVRFPVAGPIQVIRPSAGFRAARPSGSVARRP